MLTILHDRRGAELELTAELLGYRHSHHLAPSTHRAILLVCPQKREETQ